MVLVVGGMKEPITTYTPMNVYLVADDANISAAQQFINKVPAVDAIQAMYAREPIVAIRTANVDKYGNYYDKNNPIPIIFDGTVEIGAVEVIGKNGNTVEPNVNGSINVVVTEAPITGHTVESVYNEVTSVASGVQTTILTYVVPLGSTTALQAIKVSGSNVATYQILVNSVVVDKFYTYYGGEFNFYENFNTPEGSTIILNSGDTLTVSVLHTRIYVGDFNARIDIIERS
jgi:hypothetical protein